MKTWSPHMCRLGNIRGNDFFSFDFFRKRQGHTGNFAQRSFCTRREHDMMVIRGQVLWWFKPFGWTETWFQSSCGPLLTCRRPECCHRQHIQRHPPRPCAPRIRLETAHALPRAHFLTPSSWLRINREHEWPSNNLAGKNHLRIIIYVNLNRFDWPGPTVVTSVTRTNSGHVCVKPIMSAMSIFPVNRGPKIPTVRVFPLRWFHLLQ